MDGTDMAHREDDDEPNAEWRDRISIRDLYEASVSAQSIAGTLLDRFDKLVDKINSMDKRIEKVERNFDIYLAKRDERDTHEIQIGSIWEQRVKSNENDLRHLKESVPQNHIEEHKKLGEKISAFPMDRLLLILATAGAVISAIVSIN